MAMSHRVSKRESETTPSGSEEHPAGACRSWTVGLRASVAPSRPRARRGNPGPTPGGDPAGEGLKQEMDQVASVYNRFVGIPDNGRRISFRFLHVWEFKDGLISRENVWLDGASIVQQMTAPEPAAGAV
jgi:hypothetical protein